MKLVERAFIVGEQTQVIFDTYQNVNDILEASIGLGYPRFRCHTASSVYQRIIGNYREQQILDVRRQLGPKQTGILINPIPYTAIKTVIEDKVLHSCLWSILPEKLGETDVDEIVQDLFGHSVCALIIEHLTKNKSLPEIQHLHVFVDVTTCR